MCKLVLVCVVSEAEEKGRAETVIESEFSELERFLEVVVILDVLDVVWNEFLYTDELEEAEMGELHGLHRVHGQGLLVKGSSPL